MRTRKSLLASLAFSASAFGLAGCVPYNTRAMPDISPRQCTYYANSRGVEVGIEPFESNSETEMFNQPNDYLKNVLREGILPAYVRVSNNSEREVFFDSRAVRFVGPAEREWELISPEEAARYKFDKRKKVNNFFAFLISPIGAALGSAEVDRTNKIRERDYVSKAIKSAELGPEQERRGFVFFKTPDGERIDDKPGLTRGKFYIYIDRDGEREEIVLSKE
ncbi:hypothetical protein D6817_04680 [Candidatus Pacearchaeota archaeon]|nr:MAG: hypothetical protein D6817_04680 [Candidatus Pacearchaeota archaeon]